MIKFEAWAKTPRLFKDCTITEKIDGTNAAIIIQKVHPNDAVMALSADIVDYVSCDGEGYLVGAQSRKRLITPDDDNFGFASWVQKNSIELVETLGEGRHYGEWWGSGIQRGYGLPKGEKRFSLFNTGRWGFLWDDPVSELPQLSVVPELYVGPFDTEYVDAQVDKLRENGSVASRGFMRPEGVVVFHHASRQVYKAFVDESEKHA